MPVYRKGTAWRVVTWYDGTRKDFVVRGSREDAERIEQNIAEERDTQVGPLPHWWREIAAKRRTHEHRTNIYFVQCNGGPIKIGKANDVQTRLVAMQTDVPYPLVLLVSVTATRDQERELHRKFDAYRIRGEWFTPAEELLKFIAELGHGSGTVQPAKRDSSSRAASNKRGKDQ